jgi:hypothetical protein
MSSLDDNIIATSEIAAIAAIKEYENISKADPYNIPEYWIVCHLARELAGKNLTVECEKRIDEMVLNEKFDGRVDLVVSTEENEHANRQLRALIEVKGPRTTWSSFPEDFVRLKNIAKLVSTSDLLIGLIYATPPMTDGALNEERERLKRCLADVAPLEKIRVSKHQHLQHRHTDRTAGDNDFWAIMSIFEHAARAS